MVGAASVGERDALAMLKDNTLKERFIRGVRNQTVQRELRRTAIEFNQRTFIEMRNEVLKLFQDADPTVNAKVRPYEVESARITHDGGNLTAMRNEISYLRETLNEVVQVLNKKPKKKLECYNCGREGHLKRECKSPPLCFECKKFGHFCKDCPERMGRVKTPQSPEVEVVNGLVAPGDLNRDIPNNIVSNSPTAEVLIAGITTGCILDTGAEASLIPLSYYQKYLQPSSGELDSAKDIVRVTGVSGTTIPVVGFLQSTIAIRGCIRVEVPEVHIIANRSDTEKNGGPRDHVGICSGIRAERGSTHSRKRWCN
ncbi:uncharacterized protein LOC117116505 isoform X2 [Anneissia japonica]|uniref:uncharacterized protein LOC117116505 isoform X2 n=1 Tax=Anneissia japonica TaxID=1529436 RepID=UPI0014255E81|nr:uncharacterized protein LOC117116505 isoform X2 [Anneissia japonica]